jgi:glutamyl/glutaminyl-tRNA synthetase
MLARLRDRLVGAPVTRFAPSPTGRLHLGHIVNAIYVWGIAGALGGTVRLRIEDHDRERSRPEYERGILADLEWLGFVPDSIDRQSDHLDSYSSALDRLRGGGLAYWCDCSRQRIARDADATGAELRYDGYCRDRGLGPGRDRGMRVRMDDGDKSSLTRGSDRSNRRRPCSAETCSFAIGSATGRINSRSPSTISSTT